MIGQYEELAGEYYDPTRHPTCHDFRIGSLRLVKRWLLDFPESIRILETGAGRSVVAEILADAGRSMTGLTITDDSPSMLEYSREWSRRGVTLQVASATHLPFNREDVELLVASLGDPYNVPEFWREAARVVVRHGCVIFTTPSHEWATTFRRVTSSARDEAEFELRSGRRVRVPSYVRRQAEQVKLVEPMGFTMRAKAEFMRSELGTIPVSPKLLVSTGDLEIVTGFLFERSGRDLR